MEEVAHGVDEDELWFLPGEGRFQYMLMEGQLETIGVIGLAHGLQAPRHAFGVAVLAPRADFGATRQGIPGGFGPLDA